MEEGKEQKDRSKKGWDLWVSQAVKMHSGAFSYKSVILPSVLAVVPGCH